MELDPDLKAYLEPFDENMSMIRHPLVFAVPYFPEENERLNKVLKHKKEYAEKSLNDKHWGSF